VTKNETPSPLSGVRILDLTSVIMGPFATRILGDMGADVIKIESPEGDSIRTYHPFRHEGMSGPFLNLNRNKRSIVLDLKTEEGRQVLDRLIETADVFLHTMRPKAVERLGYTYDRVSALKPDIIYCGAYGFSEEGPYGDKAAYDDLIQAGCSYAATSASLYGEPAYAPTVLCDKLAGQAVAYSVLGALFARSNGAGGQKVEVPMFETAIDFMVVEHLGGFAFEPDLGPPGFARILSKKRKPFRTKDGHACILPYSDRNWRDFFAFIGRPDLTSDPRFKSLRERVLNIHELYGLIEEAGPGYTNDEWVSFCDSVSIPCMPVLAIQDLPEDPHVKAVKLFSTGEHPSEGAYKVIRAPVSFSKSPFKLRHHAPKLGEHTDAILTELELKSGAATISEDKA